MAFSAELQQRLSHELLKALKADKAGQISDVEEIMGGWESQIFSFQMELFSKGKSKIQHFVVRFYETGSVDASVAKDLRMMNAMKLLGLSVPQALVGLPSTSKDAKAYLVMEKIEGKLARFAIGADLLARQAQIQAKLHSLDIQTFEPNLMNFLSDPEISGDLERIVIEQEKKIERYQLSGFDQMQGYLREKMGVVHSRKAVLLHNDFHPENVIVRDKDEVLFIIDWGFADFGDARMDLAWTLLQIQHMQGSKERDEYLQDYEKAAGHEIIDLAFFEVLKLGARLVTLATWLLADFEAPIKKIDADAIRGTYKVHVINVYERVKEILGTPIEVFENL